MTTPTYVVNGDCEECCAKGHCGTCPNQLCDSCKDIGEFCGYCNPEKCINHEAAVLKKIKADPNLVDYYVRVAHDRELQIDCDNEEDVAFCLKQLKILKQAVDVEGYIITKSKSGNRHIIIRLKECFNPYQRIAMQACLGSDRLREMLSLVGVVQEHNAPILLIENGENPALINFDAADTYTADVHKHYFGKKEPSDE